MMLCWHDFQLDIPSIWEIVGYRKNPKTGELALADRNGEHLRVFWLQLRDKPRLENRLIELINQAHDPPLKEAQIRHCLKQEDQWLVYDPPAEQDKAPVFAGYYLADPGVLFMLTFPAHPDDPQRQTVSPVLQSFRPNPGPRRRWAAFGIDVIIPAEYKLSDVAPYPAAQVLGFEDQRGVSIRIHRYGLLDLILQQNDPTTFFARISGGKRLFYQSGEFDRGNGWRGPILRYQTRGKSGGISALLAKTWNGRVWIWQRRDIQRLFCVECHAPPSVDLENLFQQIEFPLS